MTATNHALTGAMIGFVVANPLIAIPAALASHFICDSLPHFGFSGKNELRSKAFLRMLTVDMLLCVALVLVLFSTHVNHWLLASVCAFVATSPDFMWLPRFLRARAGKKEKKPHGITWLHQHIQWFQEPIGALTEVAWLTGAVIILSAWLKAQ